MTMPKMTPWFPANVKPARAGVYQTDFEPFDKPGYSRWSGSQWSSQYSFADSAAVAEFASWSRQDKKWRGLATDPRSAK